MTTLGARALVAFGRNDIRGTYRDPLLVMIVVAPVIWTTGVAFLTPLFTEMLARRYDFDLVPYYPLVLTAFLLLTSIIIVGGLGSFLVLDEVDAGTLTALRVTPVPLRGFFAYRAATVIVVTTVYVIATTSFSGLLEPGMVPALIPIGLLSGLSAAMPAADRRMANNKIQVWRSTALACSSPGCRACRGSSIPRGISRSGVAPIGQPRRSGSPATTASGGCISLAALYTT